MYLLAWILVGAAVGWGAGRVFQGNGYGPFMDTLMGVGGAVVGGFVMRSAGFGGYGGTIVTTMDTFRHLKAGITLAYAPQPLKVVADRMQHGNEPITHASLR